MATQTVTFAYQTGKTLTLKLCSLDSDAIVDSVSATERSTDLGTYAAAFTDVAAGTYRAKVYIGAVPYASGFVKLTASTDTFEVTNDPNLNVTVAPLSASITARVNGTTINYFVGEVVAQTVAITDSAGSAVDLSAKTLQLVIDSPKASHGDVQVIASGSITVSGASNNQITFTNSAAVTATARTLRWALRDTANGDEVLAHGRVVVTDAAEED